MVPGERGREVLDAGPQRAQTTRGPRHPDLLCGRLKGFPEAIEAVYPQTTVQTCIVHLIRHSLRYVPRRQYDQVTKDLRPIYTAIDADQAMVALEAFEEKWGDQIPVIGQAWRNSWEYVTPFMVFEPEVRRSFTRQTRSRRSTGSYARRSRRRAASPARTPPGS